MERPLSVEVLRDADAPQLDITPVIEGVEYFNDVTDGLLTISNTSRRMRIAHADSSTVHGSLLNFKTPETDIQLVLTDRNLRIDSSPRAVGYAVQNTKSSGGVAVISTNSSVTPAELTTAHELGHLVRLRYGATYTEHHCTDDQCLMHAHTNTINVPIPTQRPLFRHFIPFADQLFPMYVPDFTTEEVMVNTSFCDTCIHQLGRRAFFITEARKGRYIPPEWR